MFFLFLLYSAAGLDRAAAFAGLAPRVLPLDPFAARPFTAYKFVSMRIVP